MQIKQRVVSSHPILYRIARWLRWRLYFLKSLFIDKLPEVLHIWLYKQKISSKSKYSFWSKYKDKHKGKRCFIVATGPSLTFEDLELIKDEFSFGVNSIVKILDKTRWCPSYYGIQDPHVYEKLKSKIHNSNFKEIFVSHVIQKKEKLDLNRFKPYFLKSYKFIPAYDESPYITSFSNDVSKKVFSGYSITYSMLQVAVYMGFKEIYLLGADCSYSQDKSKQHFVESGYHDKYAYLAGKKMIDSYKYAKEYADNNNVKIYNATRGGMLEVFERVKLEKLFNNLDKNTDSLNS